MHNELITYDSLVASLKFAKVKFQNGWCDDDFETNGWEDDTWYYFSHEDYEYQVVIYYCGYTFSIEMYRSDIDD